MIVSNLTGSFDIIGDVHGCYPELLELLHLLGYQVSVPEKEPIVIIPPSGRRLIFVGDLVDRGPDSPAVLKLVMQIVDQNAGFCVIGNHDDKLLRKLLGRRVQINHGLDITLEQLKKETPHFSIKVRRFFEALPYFLWIDDGKLLVAHAGLAEKYHGVISKKVRELSLFGPTSGKLDEFGLPQRINWAQDYNGKPLVVYGHTPVREPNWQNNTVNIDTGCVFGGKLTALRYPELEIVSVDHKKLYTEPRRPF
jgi:protein phosphatase